MMLSPDDLQGLDAGQTPDLRGAGAGAEPGVDGVNIKAEVTRVVTNLGPDLGHQGLQGPGDHVLMLRGYQLLPTCASTPPPGPPATPGLAPIQCPHDSSQCLGAPPRS